MTSCTVTGRRLARATPSLPGLLQLSAEFGEAAPPCPTACDRLPLRRVHTGQPGVGEPPGPAQEPGEPHIGEAEFGDQGPQQLLLGGDREDLVQIVDRAAAQFEQQQAFGGHRVEDLAVPPRPDAQPRDVPDHRRPVAVLVEPEVHRVEERRRDERDERLHLVRLEVRTESPMVRQVSGDVRAKRGDLHIGHLDRPVGSFAILLLRHVTWAGHHAVLPLAAPVDDRTAAVPRAPGASGVVLRPPPAGLTADEPEAARARMTDRVILLQILIRLQVSPSRAFIRGV